MARPGTVPDSRDSRLYARILYDTELESTAFEKLAIKDFDGCCLAFNELVSGLDLHAGREHGRTVVQLFAETLQRVNRLAHHGPGSADARRSNRLGLIESFAECSDPEVARQRFRSALDSLLAPLRQTQDLHPTIERAKNYIREHYQHRIYLAAVAEAVEVSPNYLSRLFHREAGVTLTAYVQRIRLRHAMRLLEEGRHSLSEIAYRVGYQNYRDFYRNFVRRTGLSPRELQRKMSRRPGRAWTARGDSEAGAQLASSNDPSA